MPPPYSRTLFELRDEQGARGGIAVLCGEQSLAYRELAARARRAATVLRAHGVRRGDCVGLLINWFEPHQGCLSMSG